jgi:hypothetical protein
VNRRAGAHDRGMTGTDPTEDHDVAPLGSTDSPPDGTDGADGTAGPVSPPPETEPDAHRDR